MSHKAFRIKLLMFCILISVLQGGCESHSDSHSSQKPTTNQAIGNGAEGATDVQFMDSEQLDWLNEQDIQLAREREQHLKNSIDNYNYILDN